ncbi:Lsr2 dimerization domain-containing protein [Pseudonocardia aurantiaca]|uniref:Lsr2 dimerization domain-containing protein n=1 Tax=Pseudonocardia aurantiaca TaxID=75290 RepID=UPI003CD05718
MTRLVDDLDGSEAVATVSFSLDGVSFEIDLSEGHLAEFRAALHPFVRVARQASGDRETERTTTRTGASATTPAPAVARGPEVPREERDTPPPPPPLPLPLPPAPAPAPAPAPEREVVDEVALPTAPPKRKRAPLVTDPFNPMRTG